MLPKSGRSSSNLIARECIVTALLQLIYEKPMSSITISELTKRAGVSRVTFYRNYTSKEEVFISELKEIVAHYEAEEPATQKRGIYYDQQHMTRCFRYFYTYRAFMDGLIYCGFGDVFLRLITEYVQQKWSNDPSNPEQTYRLAAFSGMLYNVYSAWVQLDCTQPPEQIAEIVERMCKTGFGTKSNFFFENRAAREADGEVCRPLCQLPAGTTS